MKAVTALGILMLVLAFLSSAMDAFPLGWASANEANSVTEDTPFSKDAVEDTAAKMGSMYGAVIEDIISFQRNPDLALAEARSAEMNAYAGALANSFEELAETLQVELDTLVPGDGPSGEGAG